jgi:hypothetical protein
MDKLNKQIKRQEDNIRDINNVTKELEKRIKLIEEKCDKEFEKARIHVMNLLWKADEIDNLLRKNKYSKEDEKKLTDKMRKAKADAINFQHGPLRELRKKCEDAKKLYSDRLQNFLTANSKRIDLVRKLSARLGKKKSDAGNKRKKSIRKIKRKSKSKKSRKRKSKSKRKKSCKKGYRRNRSTGRCRKI